MELHTRDAKDEVALAQLGVLGPRELQLREQRELWGARTRGAESA